ncbi:chitin synthase III catalytic subunit [Lipomyces tetrasporus]|uniref:Chitin synthase III catalytic subunit n=1 Tax=Lipomyces tetrasporus TaxID=54092 RepID=A0AAD7QMV4_9ASCO|nr:chitin synthase III catalytic subunit [Lipomyces tetrasporus]KAJ8098255.1 chitin synthase III catalytic subunit [Lipomyces tetrasporus]
MATNYGNFNNFCYYSNLPACNLFDSVDKYCPLVGFQTVTGSNLGNLGLILLCFFAIVLSTIFIVFAQRRAGAVGRREMQILYLSYIIVSISAIFASGGFIFNRTVLIWFSAIEIASTASTAWLLLINAVVAYQFIPDGGFLSVTLTLLSGLAVFIGTGYIALDSGFSWTGEFASDPSSPDLLRNYALYTVYLLFPIIAIVVYFLLELYLVVRILRERKPLFLLIITFLLFVIGQIFEFVISRYICSPTSGKIDGSLFACLFTLLSFGVLWAFWESITEDEWVGQAPGWEAEMREL